MTTFEQIDEFNGTVLEGGVKIQDARYYVSSDVAKDVISFLKHISFSLKNDSTILDICFGSGNLTAHIVNDLNLQYKELILNDKYYDKINNQISINNTTITQNDFLDSNMFINSYDLVIFNPQIGGATKYKDGELKISKKYKGNLKHLKETLSKVTKDDGYLFFKGAESTFDSLEFDTIGLNVKYMYMSENGYIYILQKTKEKLEKICYEKIKNLFIVNKDCSKKQTAEEITGNLSDIFTNINDTYTQAKQVFQKTPFSKAGAMGGNSETISEDSTSTQEIKKPEKEEIRFANFLIGEKQQYKKDKKRFRNFLND